MTRQCLADREIAIALSELSGKLEIHEIRDHLKAKGLIAVAEDFLDNYECELTRKAIQRARKYDNPDGTGKVELVNLFEAEEGQPQKRYYKNLFELTVDEGVQICTYWHNRAGYANRELLRYAKAMKKIHGKKFQRRLPFDLPVPDPSPAP